MSKKEDTTWDDYYAKERPSSVNEPVIIKIIAVASFIFSAVLLFGAAILFASAETLTINIPAAFAAFGKLLCGGLLFVVAFVAMLYIIPDGRTR